MPIWNAPASEYHRQCKWQRRSARHHWDDRLAGNDKWACVAWWWSPRSIAQSPVAAYGGQGFEQRSEYCLDTLPTQNCGGHALVEWVVFASIDETAGVACCPPSPSCRGGFPCRCPPLEVVGDGAQYFIAVKKMLRHIHQRQRISDLGTCSSIVSIVSSSFYIHISFRCDCLFVDVLQLDWWGIMQRGRKDSGAILLVKLLPQCGVAFDGDGWICDGKTHNIFNRY